jgi:hypothetical protein
MPIYRTAKTICGKVIIQIREIARRLQEKPPQEFGKHASTIEAVFSMWSVPRSYLEGNRYVEAG